ncbi:TonB-dependent receptor [Steroidobacter agaridevorans]|uniref:TonB-dependent receptor n=1 Tax=Steroidobacter agaridevorans TaxID=2695856 RepID=UPI001322584F|nr:TonB-dependent receptor [Steroidobacter agaridevorans]GFE90152.1 TonB-dependent receptor [Steroidobacter agaridevorans]
MRLRNSFLYSVSALTLLGSASAFAQEAAPAAGVEQLEEVVVTGIRQSLERAAEIKRESAQVVDSIVAEDIGKFPDATTAAALQRVPGVQVTVGANNEVQGVLIRGLGDILTTLDGREIFSTTGRGFAVQDLPAEALSRVDVIKSSTSNLIEGGIAGVTDLRLHKPFNFNERTFVATARANYPDNVDEVNPQFGFLATDRWDVGNGEIGALLNVTWYKNDFDRPISFVAERRSLVGAPHGETGVLAPNTFGGLNDYGWYERPQANLAIQWQATDNLEVYLDGLYAGYRDEQQSAFVATPFFFAETQLESLEVDESRCFLSRVTPGGFNPNLNDLGRKDAEGNPDPNFDTDTLCNMESARFSNVRGLTSTQAKKQDVDNYLGAIGFKWNNGPTSVKFDTAYQRSEREFSNVIVDIGKHITVDIDTDVNEGGMTWHPGNPLGTEGGWFLRNGLNQNFEESTGELWQTRLDFRHELDGAFGFIRAVEAGVRYADRSALFEQAQLNVGAPGGDLATSLDGLPLPADFLVRSPGIDRINNGASVLLPNPDYLRSAAGRDVLRQIYGAPTGNPAFQPQRRFDASEDTYAAYFQLDYSVPVGGLTIDGLIGARPTRTERHIEGAGVVNDVVVPRIADTTDTEVLPNASARIDFNNGFQARASYAKTMRRPEFNALNPGLNYIVATNPSVINSGNAGNPNLKSQISDSYDATLEYYFGPSMVSAAVYYRDLKDRVITAPNTETIDGIDYNISRPRNVGAATLQGIEVSGQTFFDFLPGVWSGFGAFANYTYADTEVKGDDVLAGFPLQGVSKDNFTVGLLYDKLGVSGRLVYTARSRYYDADMTGTNVARPIEADRVNDLEYIPTVLNYVRPGGRLDFSIGYDITDAIRVDVGGSNILRNRYKSYFDVDWLNRDFRYDDTIYTLGVRVRM